MRERRNIECTKRRTQSHYSGSSGAGVKINRIGPIIRTNELLFSLDLITAVSPMSVAIRICISDIWDKCTALLYKLNIMSNLLSFQPNLMRKPGAGKRRERGLRIRPFDCWTIPLICACFHFCLYLRMIRCAMWVETCITHVTASLPPSAPAPPAPAPAASLSLPDTTVCLCLSLSVCLYCLLSLSCFLQSVCLLSVLLSVCLSFWLTVWTSFWPALSVFCLFFHKPVWLSKFLIASLFIPYWISLCFPISSYHYI